MGWILLAAGVLPLPVLFGLLVKRNRDKAWLDVRMNKFNKVKNLFLNLFPIF